jgi:hypothetical protein
MVFPILIAFSALSLATVAAYFSIIGLTTIFPGAFWSIVVMGSTLEVGKLVTAVWLHRNWKKSSKLLKLYLTGSVVILSFITSMGIFGFLSKSHIEQEAGSAQQISQINLLNNKIESIESKKMSLTQRKENNNQLKEEDFNFLSRLNDRLKLLDDAVSDIRSKGGFSVNSKLKELSDLQSQERLSITNQKNDIQSRLDQYRVRNEEEIFPELSKLEEELLSINVNKTKLESELKKLEAEIGPIKYIAEIISDFGGPQVDAESAVRIVILILIFVFDPLAILLVVAASATFKEATGEVMPKDVADMRNKILSELEMHLAEGKTAESFVERYKI